MRNHGAASDLAHEKASWRPLPCDPASSAARSSHLFANHNLIPHTLYIITSSSSSHLNSPPFPLQIRYRLVQVGSLPKLVSIAPVSTSGQRGQPPELRVQPGVVLHSPAPKLRTCQRIIHASRRLRHARGRRACCLIQMFSVTITPSSRLTLIKSLRSTPKMTKVQFLPYLLCTPQPQ